jgi:hypothetical protein
MALPAQPTLPATELIAGPPSASPPLLIAVMLVALSIAGPFIFVADGTPSLLLGITAVAVALAGMITMLAAVRAQLRRRADAAARRRVSISHHGITLHPTPAPSGDVHFPWEHITGVQVATAAFILQAGPEAAKPGRHAIRFGKLVTPRRHITSVVDAFQAKVRGPQ